MRKNQLVEIRERYDRLLSEFNESACAESLNERLNGLLRQAYRCGRRGEALEGWLESREGEACRNELDSVLDETFCAGLLYRDTLRAVEETAKGKPPVM